MSKRAQDIDSELFHPQNEAMALPRLKRRLRASLEAKVNSALAIMKKAIEDFDSLEPEEKAFHQKVMTSKKSGNFDNA